MMASPVPVINVRGIEDWDDSVVRVASYSEDTPAGTACQKTVYYCERLGVFIMGVVYHDSMDSSSALFPLCATRPAVSPHGDPIPPMAEYLLETLVSEEDRVLKMDITRFAASSQFPRSAAMQEHAAQ